MTICKAIAIITVTAGLASVAAAQDRAMIINEYNCVGDITDTGGPKFLENDDEAFEGYDYGQIYDATAGAGAGKQGRVQGNGANWIEFVVVQDHLDARGWSFEWSDIDPDAGGFTFTNDPVWSNLRSGTIITVMEDSVFTPTFEDLTTGPEIDFPTKTTFTPDNGDFWLHFDVDDSQYLTQTGFKVDNDAWQGAIRNATDEIVFGPVGEAVAPGAGHPSAGWGGSGINSQEMAVLHADPSATTTGLEFNDRDYSTFGAPNLIDVFDNAATLEQLEQQEFEGPTNNIRQWWTDRVAGDADVDGDVDLSDLGVLATAYGEAAGQFWADGNFDGDGDVDLSDLGALASNYGAGQTQAFADFQTLTGVEVPEPSTVVSLCIGILVGFARVRTLRGK